MAARSLWGQTPQQSIEAECRRRGKSKVVAGCVDLLAGRDADAELVIALGGPQALRAIHGDQRYWLRVWAARGLLWAWDDAAITALTAALTDEVWRVREMACKVVARHLVDDVMPLVAELRDDDPVRRVRAAAGRAVVLLTAAGE